MSQTITLRLDESTTPEEAQETLKVLRTLLVKCWLIAEHRIDDLLEYDRTGDVRFEQEAERAGNRVTISERA